MNSLQEVILCFKYLTEKQKLYQCEGEGMQSSSRAKNSFCSACVRVQKFLGKKGEEERGQPDAWGSSRVHNDEDYTSGTRI